MIDKEILLIARNFPPMGGVGTRRWSKFCKHLANRGYTIHVITINYKNIDTVNWLHDVQHPNIIIHRLKGIYPNWLLRHKKRGFFEKKTYEIFRLIYQFKCNWMDNAQGWESQLIPYARKLIKSKSLKNVIVTAAPCSVAYMASIIKVENPNINLIVDFRDKWNDEPQYAYGSAIKSFAKKEKAVNMELQTMLHADKIVVTTESIKKAFSSIYKTCQNKYVVIHNGYDTDEYLTTNTELNTNKDVLNIVYFGSLLGQKHLAIDLLAKAIKKLDDPFFTHQFKVDIYGIPAANYSNPIPDIVRYKPLINPKEIAATLSKYQCGLSILDPHQSDFIGSKAFDYMATNKAILHISNGGDLFELLEKENQYCSNFKLDELVETLLKLKSDFENQQLKQGDFKAFDISKLTSKYEQLFV